ncbi:MAG TPA: hypothetical protein PLQ38_07175, partial [Methanothrix sp.]|nr:hypothetical protein [Methanothrix sp.]
FDPESWYWEEQSIEEEYSTGQLDQFNYTLEAGSDIWRQNEVEEKSWWQLILEIIEAASS